MSDEREQCEAKDCENDATYCITDEETNTLEIWLCDEHFAATASGRLV